MGSVCCHRSLCSGDWPSTLSLPSRSLRAGKSKWFGWVAPFASCSLRHRVQTYVHLMHTPPFFLSVSGAAAVSLVVTGPCLCRVPLDLIPQRGEGRNWGGRCCQKTKASLHSRHWLFWLFCGSMAMVEKVVLVVLTGEQGEHSTLSHSTLTRS